MNSQNSNIKFVVFDFDGVFTDGKIYYHSNGLTSKYYNVKDSYAVRLLEKKGYTTGLISGNVSDVTPLIAKHLRFNYVSVGKNNKYEILDQWRQELNLRWENVAYVGDDLVDIKCLEKVGLSACPSDAMPKVKEVCQSVLEHKGGKGAVREFVDKFFDTQF